MAQSNNSTSPTDFWIDVGGTFTDCLIHRPDGDIQVLKVLSSSVIKGVIGSCPEPGRFHDSALEGYPKDMFTGYRLRIGSGETLGVLGSQLGELAHEVGPEVSTGLRYEIISPEPAPLLAIRLAFGLRLSDPIENIRVRLATTRATNALLEHKGSTTAFITTDGFTDILRIGNQDRPHLFDLNVRKPRPLFAAAASVHERLAADGSVLAELDEKHARDLFADLRDRGIESLAIALLHSYRDNRHEVRLRELAQVFGFRNVSISSDISPTIKLISRGDTTVVDAYLTPVLRDHVMHIEERVPEKSLRLLTSAGGLVTPGSMRAKDMILSGPAGGVVAVAQAAHQAGFDKAIGFDMGGTSTDVSRYDGAFEYEYETQKAGARIVAPMLAIETVAAGGGSICHFDGTRLQVGPESAGAEPGPACYGSGGPLTVTDLNLFLGRIPPDRFPFPLDIEAVQQRLETLCAEVKDQAGMDYTTTELAEGFLRIANAKMAAAIRGISVARGYDARGYTLVSFGGAGGQHACAVARELGMTRVLMHPQAGVLSALGAGLADVKKFSVRMLLKSFDNEAIAMLDSVFTEMKQEIEAALAEDSIPDDLPRSYTRKLDLRYRGQGSPLTVGEDSCSFKESFLAMHEQLYGYTFSDRPIEVVTARLEVSAVLFQYRPARLDSGAGSADPEGYAESVFAGRQCNAPVYIRSKLSRGSTLSGPALIAEETSVTVLEPGWQLSVLDHGELLLEATRNVSDEVRQMNLEQADPVRLELYNNQFASIAQQMGETLRKTSLSVNVKERLDYSCALFTPEGDLVVNAPHMPVHLGAMSECVKCVIQDIGRFCPGDVVITNDPMRGGSHIPDVTVVTAVFDEAEERLLFFVASRAHHAEIGGIRPGSMPPDSRSLADEGVLIRAFKLIDAGRENYAKLRELLSGPPHPSRAVEDNICDIEAQVAANRKGAHELLALTRFHGIDVVHTYMRFIQEAAERKIRAALGHIPDGVYHFRDVMDTGATIQARISIAGEEAVIDFTGTSEVQADNLNANRAIVTAAVLYCFRCLIGEDIPLNAGVLKPINIVLPECFLNPPAVSDPEKCPAVVGGNVETSQRVVDVLLGALDLVAASQGTMNNLSFGNRNYGYYETICGGTGAGPGFAGCDAVHSHMTNTRLTDPEVLEAQYPVRLHRFEIRRGSGGRGDTRGGDGICRELEFLEDMEVSMLSQRRQSCPYGIRGGEAGLPGANRFLAKGARKWEELPPAFSRSAAPGDRIQVLSPGGGGCGEPI